MSHFIFFFWVISCMAGAASVVIYIILYLKNNKQVYLNYFLYLLFFSFIMILNAIVVYKQTNITDKILFYFFLVIKYLLCLFQYCLFYFLIISIILAAEIKKINKIKLFMRIYFISVFIIQNIVFFIFQKEIYIIRFGQIALIISYLITFVISTYFLFYSLKNNIKKKLFISSYIIFSLFLPLLFLDILMGKFKFVWNIIPDHLYFILFFYFIWNVFSIIIGVKLTIRKNCIKQEIILNDEYIKQYNISNREIEIINLILEGKSNSEIADQLFISLGTVKTHVINIFRKTSVSSRYSLINSIMNNK